MSIYRRNACLFKVWSAFLILSLAALLGLGAVAAAAATRQVSKAGADSGGCVSAPCLTVAYAISQAAPGDAIEVGAGNYDEQLTIAKPLTLEGAPGGATSIGPAAATGVVAQTEITLAAGAGGSTLRDLTVNSRAQNQAAIATSGGAPIDGVDLERVAVTGLGASAVPATLAAGLEVNLPAAGWTISDCGFEDHYFGILVSGDMEDLTIEGSEFVRDRIGFNVQKTTPLGPTSTGTVEGLQLSDSRFVEDEYRGLYFEGLSDATIEDIVVTGTGQGVAPLPFGSRGLALNLKDGDYENIAISDSTFSGSVNEGVAVQVRGYPGDSSYEAHPATLDSLQMTGLTLTGNGGPGLAVDNEENIGSVAITASRIAGNGDQAIERTSAPITAPVTGVYAWNDGPGSAPVSATDNWYGCNDGPVAGAPRCDGVTAAVGAAPWLVLTAAASPSTVAAGGGQSTLTAAIDTDSAGAAAGPAPDGTPVSFSSGLGSLSAPATTLVGGRATSLFLAGAQAGNSGAGVSVDAEQLTVPLSVLSTPAAPPPPAPAPPAPSTVEPSGNGNPKVVPENGHVTVATVSCEASSCEVKAKEPAVKIGGKSYKIKVKMPAKIASGDSASIQVILPKGVREALTENGKGRVTVKLTVTGSDGSSRTVNVTVVLKSKQKKGQHR